MINRSTQIAETIHQFQLTVGIFPYIVFAFNIVMNCIAVLRFRLQLNQVFNKLINRFNFQINVMKISQTKSQLTFAGAEKKS